ncbi:hypothetical protein MMPV_005856 [Pyropia vietnamensis]
MAGEDAPATVIAPISPSPVSTAIATAAPSASTTATPSVAAATAAPCVATPGSPTGTGAGGRGLSVRPASPHPATAATAPGTHAAAAAATAGVPVTQSPGGGSPPPAKRRRAAAPPPRRAPPPGRKAHGADLPSASPRDYVVTTCGRRLVVPYSYTWVLNAKARWRGRALGDVLATELHRPQPAERGSAAEEGKEGGTSMTATADAAVDATAEYWAREVTLGRLQRNGAPTTIGATIVNGDVLTHAIHRHESSTGAHPLPHLLAVTPTLTAWAKPPGVPVHPCGTYRRGALTHLLAAGGWMSAPDVTADDVAAVAAAAATGGLAVVHRLDAVTGGVLVLARGGGAAAAMAAQIRGGEVTKVYVARVVGRFPGGGGAVMISNDLVYTPGGRATWAPITGGEGGGGVPVADCGLFKGGVSTVGRDMASVAAATGAALPISRSPAASRSGAAAVVKRARTAVSLRCYDAATHTSVVEASPVTGRTHQIRLHLAAAGHPIVDDRLYNEAAALMSSAGSSGVVTGPDAASCCCVHCTDGSHPCVVDAGDRERLAAAAAAGAAANCDRCPSVVAGRGDRLGRSDAVALWAVRYAGDGWSFEWPPGAEGVEGGGGAAG